MKFTRHGILTLRILIILILTVNPGNFEMQPIVDRIFNHNASARFWGIFLLALSFIISADAELSKTDVFDALLCTCLFMLVVKPTSGFEKDAQDPKSIRLDELNGTDEVGKLIRKKDVEYVGWGKTYDWYKN